LAQRLVYIFVAILLLTTVTLGSNESILESQKKLNDLNKEMEKIRSNLEASNKKEKQILTNLNDLDKTLDKLDREKNQLNSSIQKLNQELKTLESELANKQKELDQSEAKLNTFREDAANSLRNLQKTDARSWWSFVIDAKNLSELWIRSHQMKKFLAADLESIEKTSDIYEEHLKKVNELQVQKEQLNKKKAELEGTKKKLQNNEMLVKGTLAEKQKLLDKVTKEKNEYDKALREMEKASQEIGEAIRKLQEKTREDDGLKKVITMIWPVPGRITSDYGWRLHPILKENRFHTGLDIGAGSGKDIKAAADGTVILAGWVQGYGLTLIISHGNKTTTLYGHTSKLLVNAGDKVKQGQVVAKVGSTGVSSGPHLHFEIRVDGDPVNPWGWLPVVK